MAGVGLENPSSGGTEETRMSDQFSMGRSDQKGREQEEKLKRSVKDGAGSVAGARKSLSKVADSFRGQAELLVDRAAKAFAQLNTLVDQGDYSGASDLVDEFEAANAAALTELERRVESGEMPLTMVAVVVQNLRTVRDRTVGL
jgi:hypothetical protein